MGVVAAGGDAMVPNGSAERSHITFDIAENLVGALLGREGKNISDIQAICGTQIQLAPKKKFPQGRRSVTITGTQNAVQATHSLIQQRLLQSEEKRGQLENVSPPSSAVSSPQQQLPLSPSSQFA
jgi:KH domain